MAGLLICAAAPLPSQTPQPERFVRLEAGRSEIHRATSSGLLLAARIGRSVGTGTTTRIGAGASYATADENYAALELHVETRPATGHVSPFGGFGLGVLLEPEFFGAILSAEGGLDVRLSSQLACRIGLSVGRHGGTRGPHLIFVGFETRWHGRRGFESSSVKRNDLTLDN